MTQLTTERELAAKRGKLLMILGVALIASAAYLGKPEANWFWQAIYPPFAV